jgi:hypothetical protein
VDGILVVFPNKAGIAQPAAFNDWQKFTQCYPSKISGWMQK